MTDQTTQALAIARIRQWRNVRGARLVIEPEQIAIYSNSFLSSPKKLRSFETNRLVGVEQDATNKTTRLKFNSDNGETEEETFSFADKAQAEAANAVLDNLLKEAEERKRQQEEEAARLKRELQEHLRQIREEYAFEIWSAAEILWLIVKANYAMVDAVITANWSEVKRQYSNIWQHVERLKKSHPIEIEPILKLLDEAVASQTGQEVITNAGRLINELSEQVMQNQTWWNKWQEQRDMLSAVIPNFNHLPYFLLYSAGHFEALLAAKIEDWTGVDSALSLLQPSGIILQHCFGLNLNEQLDAASSAARERKVDLVAETAREVESAMFESFKNRPFRFEPVVPLKEVDHNGSMPA